MRWRNREQEEMRIWMGSINMKKVDINLIFVLENSKQHGQVLNLWKNNSDFVRFFLSEL